jgi:hypothetical protein
MRHLAEAFEACLSGTLDSNSGPGADYLSEAQLAVSPYVSWLMLLTQSVSDLPPMIVSAALEKVATLTDFNKRQRCARRARLRVLLQ